MKEHHILFIIFIALIILFNHVFDRIGTSHIKEGVSSVVTGQVYCFKEGSNE